MKQSHALIAALVLGSVGGSAGTAAADIQANLADAPENPLVTPWTRPQGTYRFIDPGLGGAGLGGLSGDGVSAVESNVIYLNNCKPNGCMISPGGENAPQNRSSIPNQNSTVQPYAYSDSNWQEVVSCVRATYAPFAVEIVTERPASGSYHMAIVAGLPQNIGMQQGVGGVSPYSCGYINNAISFSFANVYGGDVADICWTVAQETAHSWGLDHKFDNRDPMTYLSSGPARKTFQNEAGPCGEFSARSCQCGGSSMNSFVEIMQTFGASTPTPPTVSISAPRQGDRVEAGFPIRADIMDDIGASKAELRIDGNLVGTLTAAPWVWNAPMSLAQGNHIIKVTGYDIGNAAADATVTVSIGDPCGSASDCTGEGQTCVDGRCVAGPSVDGGLGATCVENAECASNQCASDGTSSYCVEQCDPAGNGCPGDFGCINTGGSSGVCWPGAGDGGGCSASGGDASFALFGLGLGALLLTRRRRRS